MRIIKSDEDCADCICRVCALNSCNDSWNEKVIVKTCECDCQIGDYMYESEDDCDNFLPDMEDV